ncbi:hypothetical protein ES703_119871 [subsurface metagenome]
MFGRRFRMRSPKNVVDEIEYLYKTYDATQFTFCDDAFTVDNWVGGVHEGHTRPHSSRLNVILSRITRTTHA